MCVVDIGGRTCVSQSICANGLLLILKDVASVRVTGQDAQTGRLELKLVGEVSGERDLSADA